MTKSSNSDSMEKKEIDSEVVEPKNDLDPAKSAQLYTSESDGNESDEKEAEENLEELEKVTRLSMSPTEKEMVSWVERLIGFVPYTRENITEIEAKHPHGSEHIRKFDVEIERVPEAICRLFTGTTYSDKFVETRATSQSASNGLHSPDSAGSAEKENNSASVNAKNAKSKKSKKNNRKKSASKVKSPQQPASEEELDDDEPKVFDHESILEMIKKLDDSDAIRFFDLLHEIIIRHTIPGETDLERTFRMKELAHDARLAFTRWKTGQSKSLDESYEEADRLTRKKKYKEALHAINDAIFYAIIRPYTPIYAWYAKDEESDNESDSSSTASSSDRALTKRPMPYHYTYFDLRYRQIELLSLARFDQKASLYGFDLLEWMAVTQVNGVKDYFATTYPVMYSLVQMWVGEAEINMDHPTNAVDKCSIAIQHICALQSNAVLDRDLFNGRKIMFERMKDYYEEDGSTPEHIAMDREAARIIVNLKGEKVVRDDKFYVTDLPTALKLAKDGQTIFLENGTYSPSAESSDSKTDKKNSNGSKAAPKKPIFEFRKNITIIGASTSRTIISGSFVKWGMERLMFRRLKLEIGLDIDANDDAYFMEGSTVMENVVIESPVNTAMYVISPNFLQQTEVTFKHCIFDGLENCRRMIAFEGTRPTITVESCYASDLFSFITVISPEEVSSAVIAVINSVFTELQDGLKMIVHHSSNIAVSLAGCHLELLQYSPEVPSHGFSLTGGTARIYGNLIFCQNLDSVGFSLHSLRRADIEVNMVESSRDEPRQVALGQGIVLSDNITVNLASTEAVGMRVGFQLSNSYPENNEIVVKDCGAKECSLGFHVKGTATAEELAEDPTARNLDSTLIQNHFASCFHGILCDDPRSRLGLYGCSFYDVLKPIVLLQSNLHQVKICGSEFKHTRDYAKVDIELVVDESDVDHKTMSKAEVIEKKLAFHLASKENLPFQLSVDMDMFSKIANESDEREFARKYKLWREAEIK